MPDVSTDNKTIARTAVGAFGGSPKVTRFWDADEESFVDLLTCEGGPRDGVTSFSTLGLSDSPLLVDGREAGIRVELVGACASTCDAFGNILSTAAFCIINSKWSCSPGTMFPDIVGMYDCSSTMKHLLFVPPFLWEERLETLDFDSKTVAWLLAVPVSDAEYAFAQSEGVEALENLFEEKQIDIYDINRPSVL